MTSRKTECKPSYLSGKQTPMKACSTKRTAKISKRHEKVMEKITRQESKLNRYLRSNQKIDETTKTLLSVRISPRRSSIVEKR